MLSENRIYNAIGKLRIKKSRELYSICLPKDDKQNWLFLRVGDKKFSFVYKMEHPTEANYNSPFLIKMAFTMDYDVIKNFVFQNGVYEVFRAEEIVGSVKIITILPPLPPG